MADVFTYRGEPVPVLDLCELTLGRSAHGRLSTRILLVNYPVGLGENRLLGIIAEKATETVRMETEAFHDAGVKNDGAPYLGPVANHSKGMLQWVMIEQLLPLEMQDRLFKQAAEVGAV